MRILINGIEKDIPVDTTITDLFTLTGIDPEQVVAELNGTVVAPENYGKTALNDGNSLELIQFVGGG